MTIKNRLPRAKALAMTKNKHPVIASVCEAIHKTIGLPHAKVLAMTIESNCRTSVQNDRLQFNNSPLFFQNMLSDDYIQGINQVQLCLHKYVRN